VHRANGPDPLSNCWERLASENIFTRHAHCVFLRAEVCINGELIDQTVDPHSRALLGLLVTFVLSPASCRRPWPGKVFQNRILTHATGEVRNSVITESRIHLRPPKVRMRLSAYVIHTVVACEVCLTPDSAELLTTLRRSVSIKFINRPIVTKACTASQSSISG
jgi:hypothetical protein